MIIGKDVHPQRKIYYLGALVLRCLAGSSADEINVYSLYEEVKKIEGISHNAFMLALDWLFLLGAINYENGVLTHVSKTPQN